MKKNCVLSPLVSLSLCVASALTQPVKADQDSNNIVDIFSLSKAASANISPEQEREMVLGAYRSAAVRAARDDLSFVKAFYQELSEEQKAKQFGAIYTESQYTDPSAVNLMNSFGIKINIDPDPTAIKNTKLMIVSYVNGDPSIRIVGPFPTVSTNFMNCVAVGYNGHFFGSGVLIAKNAVLTAAHVATNPVSEVFFGTNVHRVGGFPIPATGPPIFFNYDPVTHSNDIAILTLDRDVLGIEPCQLAVAQLIDGSTNVRVAGFGITNITAPKSYGIKKDVSVPIKSLFCDSTARTNYTCNIGIELVASDPIAGNDTCYGDSGGPAYVWNNADKKWYLAGITSRWAKPLDALKPDRACGNGGVYTRVDHFASQFTNAQGIHW